MRLGTMDRPMQQDFGDQLEAGADRALREGRRAEEGVFEVISEAAILASKGLRTNVTKYDEELAREAQRMVPAEDRPQFFPHFRKAHDWESLQQEAEGTSGEKSEGDTPRAAPDHFFSKKQWDAVYGIRSDIVDLAAALQLPRPSRIQNLAFNDIAKGNSAVIADQAGSGKTLSYLLPLLQRHVFGSTDSAEGSQRLKLLILAPTSDLAEQIMSVARTVSTVCKQHFRVHCMTARGRLYTQRQQIAAGTDVLIATAGRLRHLISDPERPVDISSCKAVVLDEVDVLVREEADLGVEDLRKALRSTVQWVFVTATLTEVAKQQLWDFEATLKPTVDTLRGKHEPPDKKALVWHTGAGLHRVSPKCEHVIVDCTPEALYDMAPDHRLRAVMRQKVLALCWHLRQGVLREAQDDRVVIFCNTIPNCQMVENELRKMDPRDRRSGERAWKVFVLHGKRHKEDYRELAEEFTNERPKARDYFKKRILVCTDRLSRGMDFARQPVSWVVLLDWPRDATEYLRRVGRTARGGGRGGVLSFPSGLRELRMAKQVTAAAIRGLPLQGQGFDLKEKAYVLERFDPRYANWRSGEASAKRPSSPDEGEWKDRRRGDEEGDEEARGQAPEWNRAQGWEDVDDWRPFHDDRGARGRRGNDDEDDYGDISGYDDDDDELFVDSAGVSLRE